jgi:hypothetical protein
MSAQRAPRLVDLNLLPETRRPVDITGRAAIAAFGIVVAIIGLVPLSLYTNGVKEEARVAVERADSTEHQLKSLQVELGAIRGLRAELTASTKKRDAIQSERRAMRGGTRPLGEDLAALWTPAFLPPGARLKQVTGAGETLTVMGAAPGPLDAIAYAQRLATDGGFPSARLASFEPAASGGGEFTLEVGR